MQVLTPSGYKHPSTLANGDDVCAFDMTTGAAIINQVQNIDFVDYEEWCRWWKLEAQVPAYNWIRINGELTLFGEQSIWRNGVNVCHAKHLVVGDEIYDDADQPVQISSVEVLEDRERVWYRFDMSGDHSYIVDGLTVHNASRFWVGGTGTWDNSTTTHWAASSNGAGGQSVPGSADTVTFDGSSGGGTVTVNFGGAITVQSLVMGAFTGTWDNSANNNNITVSAAGTAFSISGAGTRTIKLGTGTNTLSSGNSTWDSSNGSNLTYTGNTTANIAFSGPASTTNCTFSGGGLSHGNVTFGASSGGVCIISGANTFASLSITAPNFVTFPLLTTNTISSLFAWAGSSSSQILLSSNGQGTTATVAAAASSTAQWCAFRDLTFTGSPTATNSFNLLHNSGITITAPSGGSGGGGVIGS